MTKNFLITTVMLLGLGLVATPAFTDEHRHDKDGEHRIEHRDRDHDRDHHWDRDHDREHHWDRERDRDDRHWEHDRDHRDPFARDHGDPRGWSHGEKKGWGDCDVPPGQAKKHGCDSSAGEPERHFHHEAAIAPRPVSRPITHPVLSNPSKPAAKKSVFVPHTREQIRAQQAAEGKTH
jgi:hypothetical protein